MLKWLHHGIKWIYSNFYCARFWITFPQNSPDSTNELLIFWRSDVSAGPWQRLALIPRYENQKSTVLLGMMGERVWLVNHWVGVEAGLCSVDSENKTRLSEQDRRLTVCMLFFVDISWECVHRQRNLNQLEDFFFYGGLCCTSRCWLYILFPSSSPNSRRTRPRR